MEAPAAVVTDPLLATLLAVALLDVAPPVVELPTVALAVVLIVAAKTPLLSEVAAQPAATVLSIRIAVMALMALIEFRFKMNTPIHDKFFDTFIMTG